MDLNTSSIPAKEKNIVLTGFMGAGKSTVGQILANQLHRELIDVDLEIEKKHGMTIPEIFTKWGEPRFRQIERECIAKLLSENTRQKVLSLGGGAFMQDEIRKICLSDGIVVFLDLSWETWKERISLIKDTRPLLQNKTMEEIKQLFYTRREIYSLSHITINTDNLDPDEAANQIIHTIKSASKT